MFLIITLFYFCFFFAIKILLDFCFAHVVCVFFLFEIDMCLFSFEFLKSYRFGFFCAHDNNNMCPIQKKLPFDIFKKFM
jgi:hypothetical protein